MSTATALKAVMSLSVKTTTVGHSVTARVAKSTVPAGDKLRKITLTWGDGSKAVTLASLKAKPSHRYAKAGNYTVRLTLTDRHRRTVHATAAERVKAVPSLVPPAGSYSGSTSQGYGVTFYVSSSRTSLQDISIPYVILGCTPGGAGPTSELTIAAAAISSGASFSGTASQSGVWKGYPANFVYKFDGNFTTVNTGGELQATGTFKETISFNNGTAYTCTSNQLAWTAARDTQPGQTTTPPPAGSYSGTTWQGYGLTFYVSSSRRSLQDISVPYVILGCTPGSAGPTSELTIAAAAISSDGSFSGTASQSGVWEGNPATFTYLLRGNFHSLNPAGVPRAAGTFSETVSFNNGTAYTCTSNQITWTAARDAQPAQTTSPPPAGSYSGTTWQGYGLTFDVSAGSTSLQDISVPYVILGCTPGGAGPTSELTIAAAAIGSDGSFDGTATQAGVFEGQPATFTYLFRGNFHSLNPAGVPRAAGTFSETITYSNGTAYTCSTNEITWTATQSP